MVDLGQKGWKQFHLFYWNKLKLSDQSKKLRISSSFFAFGL